MQRSRSPEALATLSSPVASPSPEAVGEVVGGVGLVAVDTHRAVTLVVLDPGAVGAVDRDLVVVGSQAVTMGVWVGEETTLQTDTKIDGSQSKIA